MCKWGTDREVNLAYPMENSKRKSILVDECIADLVQVLNDHGVHTVGCCCGHGKINGNITIHFDSFRITESGKCELILNRKKIW